MKIAHGNAVMNILVSRLSWHTIPALFFTISLASAASAMASDQDALSIPSFNGIASTSTAPVYIFAAGNHITVPRNYMVYANLYRGWVQFELRFHFPDTSGATEVNINQFRESPWKQRNIVILNRLETFGQGSLTYQNEKVSIAKKTLDTTTTDYVIIEDYPTYYTVVVTQPESAAPIVLSCLRHPAGVAGVPASARCVGEFQFRPGTATKYPGLAFRFDFDEALLPAARQVMDRIQLLLASFLAKDDHDLSIK
jgi:hypothetical protein